jgi:Tol biopolymer transport system component
MTRKRTGLCRLTVWLLAITLPSLTACAGTVKIGIAHTPPATETYSTTPMTPTMAAATTAPKAEPTPTPATNESGDDVIPFGLIYQAADALWYVNADGESVMILEQLGDGYMGPVVSPNGAQVLYTEAEDIWLADIVTGERHNLTQTLDRFECCAQWWPGQSDVILFNSWTKENEGPNYGFPTVVRPDGEQYHVLDSEQVTFALPAPSPDGQTVAYDRAGQPWLYRTDTGPEPFEFDLTPYDPLSDPQLSIVSPAWSPDGTRLAWVIGGNFAALGGWRIGTGVFDLKARTASLLHPYEPVGRGGWPSAPLWDPDGQWLVFTAWAWDSDETGAWVVRADGQQEEEYHLGQCSTPVWSPDGHWLACTSYPQSSGSGVWLVEVGTWGLQPLDLPADAYLVAWISPPGR